MDAFDAADRRLARGAAALPEAVRAGVRAAVLAHQDPGGGFRGRAGPPDRWYTAFALRVLALAGCGEGELRRAAAWWSASPAAAGDAAAAATANDALRLFALLGMPPPGRPGPPPAGAEAAGACQALLAERALAAVGRTLPAAALAMLRDCANPDGGFADRPGLGSQANATAAALALLARHRIAGPVEGAAAFLAAAQDAGGGLRAHPAAPAADLLSSFTGAWALAAAGRLHLLRLGDLGRFCRACRRADGGFGALPGDDAGDPEYAFYGLGLLGLLADAGGRRARPPAPPLPRPAAAWLLLHSATRRLGWLLLR